MRKYLFAMFLAIITFLSLGSHALAACSAPTVGSNLVLRFPSAQGVWVGAASSIRAEDTASTALNTAGVLYYDTDSNDLKLCDGTDWITLGAGGGGGGGSATLAGLSDVSVTGATNGQALVFNSSTNMWEPLTISGGISTPSATGMAWLSSTNISLTDSIWTNVPLSSGNSNLNGVTHSTTVNPSRMTVSKTGTYLVSYTLGGGIRVAGAGTNLGRLVVNGVSIATPAIQQSNSATFATELSNSVILSLTAGDYVTVQAYANVPGNTVISATLILFEIGGSGGGAGSETLSNLTDVDVTGATAGQSLVFNGTQWEAKSISGGGSFELGAPITVNTPSQAFVNTCNSTTNPSVVIPKTGYYHIKNLLRGYVYSGAVVHVTMNLRNSGGAVVYAANTGTARAVSHYITIDSTDIVNLPAGTYTMNVVIDNGSGNCAGANWDRLISASFTFREILGGGSGSGADSLADLTDVDVTGATNGQALVFNSATNTWIPGSVSVPSGAEYAFYAGGLPTLLSGNATAFPSLLFNIGNAFNNATGAFTAPVDGLYSFSFTTLFAQTGVNGSVTITKNGVGTVHSYSNNGENNSVSASAVLNLAAGDVIRLYYSTGTPFVGNNAWHAFSGYKIGGSGSGGSGSETLADLTDVDVTDATAGQSLVFNGTTWEASTVSGSEATPIAFTATANGGANQTVSPGVAARVNLSIVKFDIGNDFDTTTSRFTPKIAGTYIVNGRIGCATVSGYCLAYIVKNGSTYAEGARNSSSGNDQGGTVTAIVNMNGTTDYLELHGYTSGTTFLSDPNFTYFGAALINGGSSGGGSGSETLAGLTDVDVTGATAGQSLVFNGTNWGPGTSPINGDGIVTVSVNRNAVNQTVTPGTLTNIDWTTKEFDTHNSFDLSTDRFQPTIAGYYLISAQAHCNGYGGASCQVRLFKNGVQALMGYQYTANAMPNVTSIIYMNGSTDYLVTQVLVEGSNSIYGDKMTTFFNASLMGSGGGSGGSTTLAALTDVDTSGVTNGQSLVFNSTTSTWEPQTVTGGSGSGNATVVFSVNKNGTPQTITAGTPTKLTFSNAEFNTGNGFDLTTSRFKPTTAGKYILSGAVFCQNAFGCQPTIVKSGTQYAYTSNATAGTAQNMVTPFSLIVDMDGVNDYIELWATITGSPTINGSKAHTYFTGAILGGGSGADSLAALTDVDVSGAINGQSLVFNSTTSTWEPQTITGSGGTTVAFRGAFSVPSRATGTIDQTNYTQEYNTGSAFNATTGVFTAPQDGIYLFTGYLHAIMPVDGQLYCAFKKNGSLASYCSRFSVSNSTNPMSSGSTTLSLVTGDTVVMTSGVYLLSGTASNFMGNFSGVLLNAAGGSGGGGGTGGKFVDGTNAANAVYTTGNVGIGTATPTQQLSVSRTTQANVDGPNATKSYPIATFGAQSGAYRGLEIGAPTDNITSPVYLKITGTSSRFAILNENDVEQLTILGSGNVGIGRSAPAYKLDVNGAINATSVLVNGVPLATSTDTYWSNAGSGNIQYSGGNVGIGTSITNTAKLRIHADLNSSGIVTYKEAGASGSDIYVIRDGSTEGPGNGPNIRLDTTTVSHANILQNTMGRFGIWNYGSNSWNERLSVMPLGAVGIGTTTPAALLHVAGGIKLEDDTDTCPGTGNVKLGTLRFNSGALQICQGTAWVVVGSGAGTGKFVDGTIATDAVYTAGNVGIGTTTPRATLDLGAGGMLVSGEVELTGGFETTTKAGLFASSQGYYWASRDNANGLLFLQQLASGGGALARFGVGGSAASVGSITTDGTGTSYNTTSDARLKENLTETERGLGALMRIDVQDFNFISDAAKNRVQGFIAQQLNTVYPEAVTVGGDTIDKPWNVDYGRLTPLIVKSIQDLKAKNDALELENEQLNRKVDNMQLQMDAMKAAIEKLQAAQ